MSEQNEEQKIQEETDTTPKYPNAEPLDKATVLLAILRYIMIFVTITIVFIKQDAFEDGIDLMPVGVLLLFGIVSHFLLKKAISTIRFLVTDGKKLNKFERVLCSLGIIIPGGIWVLAIMGFNFIVYAFKLG
jgi:hypothetical protein